MKQDSPKQRKSTPKHLVAEKPWARFMGRQIMVPDMPEDAQRYLGLFDRRSPGTI